MDIAPAIASDLPISVDLDAQVDEELRANGALSHARRLSQAALHWAALRDASPAASDAFPDPYQPLLMLFERGGGFHMENGVADFEFIRVPLKTWRDHYAVTPVVELDSKSLDHLDA